MNNMILDGKIVATEIYKDLEKKISLLEKKPFLGAILVGNNAESMRYIRQKQKFAQKIGIQFQLFHFEENISEDFLLQTIENFNSNSEISGYIVQLPLPKHIESQKIIAAIAPTKDVDGFHPLNQGKILLGQKDGFIPCTPAGVMQIFEYYDIELSGKKIVILGRSNIVGKPLAALCINSGATVTSCNALTPDISLYTKTADIIVCATGKKHILTHDMIAADAIVIDVGFSVIDGKIYGDADFDSIHSAGHAITPVPGGVGPMTVAKLLENTYQAHLSLCQK